MKRNDDIEPSFENFKAAMMFIVLAIATYYITKYQVPDLLNSCLSNDTVCKVLSFVAKILPTLFCTFAAFFIELCLVTDIFRIKGIVRSILYFIILVSLPIIYIIIDPIINNLNLFG